MISPMPTDRSISLDTRILDLVDARIPRFGQQSASQLALALAQVSPGKDGASVTVEDLLNYLPARYEDRSSMVEIRHLYHELEASLDLTVLIAGGFQVRNRRSFKQRLYKFEISAVDEQRSGRS
jgi:ATP-dependent DNA helicase RecG